MLRLNKIFIFLLSFFIVTSLQGKEESYFDTYTNAIVSGLKSVDIDDKNAEFKISKKEENFDYSLKYKLSKYGYENPLIAYHINDFYNEDLYNLFFTTSVYLYENLWFDFDMNYKDSLKSIIDTNGSLAYHKKSEKEESSIKLFYKPNSIVTSSLSFENINNCIDYDKFTNQSYKNTNNKKLSFYVDSDFDFLSMRTSFYQIIKDNNYLTQSVKNDDYRKSTQELYRGIELSLSKELLEDLKVTTTAKLINVKILDSNLENLIGKMPTYSPTEEVDFKVEYLYKDVKFIGKVTHVGSRYADSLNNNKLNSYTIGSMGAVFFTKLSDENIKVDFNIKNILNQDYYLYSDTKGETINYMMNISMKF